MKMIPKNSTLIVMLIVLSFQISPATAEDWGNLKGKFVLSGTAPAPAAINVTKDQEVCGQHNLTNESLVVGKDGGIANVVIYLSVGRGKKAPKAHESYTANTDVTLDNYNCRFDPHVTTMVTSQTLNIGNKDSVGHNTKVDCVKNSPINPIVPGNSDISQKFPKPESRPVPVSCSIHPWMKGYLLIQDHPYAAVSADDGTFSIENLPTGKWEFQVWHEVPNYLTEVSINGKTEKWKKGKVKFEVKPGDNDLGTITVDMAQFK